MKPIVFLGPSLSVELAHDVLDANYVAPCAMGDVYRCVEKRPSAIVIIDGFFEQRPAVWHKEILFAINENIPVFGGASMGALRAAELQSFGMVGIGKIFNDYLNGVIEDDDEVAVVHTDSSDGYRPISEAMVNIRSGLAKAKHQQLISSQEFNDLINFAKAQFYPDRNWSDLLAYAERILDVTKFIPFKALIDVSNPPNQKRDDAIEVLKYTAEWLSSGATPEPVNFHFEQSCYWDKVVNEFSNLSNDSGQSINFSQLRNHVRIFEPNKTQLLKDMLLYSMVKREAQRLGLSSCDKHEAMVNFRRKRNLSTPEQLKEWMLTNDLNQAECLKLIEMEDTLERIIRSNKEFIDTHLLTALKLSGKYADLMSHVLNKWKPSVEYDTGLLFSDSDKLAREVLDWYQQQYEVIHSDLDNYANTLGIAGEKEFMDDLVREYSHLGIGEQ